MSSFRANTASAVNSSRPHRQGPQVPASPASRQPRADDQTSDDARNRRKVLGLRIRLVDAQFAFQPEPVHAAGRVGVAVTVLREIAPLAVLADGPRELLIDPHHGVLHRGTQILIPVPGGDVPPHPVPAEHLKLVANETRIQGEQRVGNLEGGGRDVALPARALPYTPYDGTRSSAIAIVPSTPASLKWRAQSGRSCHVSAAKEIEGPRTRDARMSRQAVVCLASGITVLPSRGAIPRVRSGISGRQGPRNPAGLSP